MCDIAYMKHEAQTYRHLLKYHQPIVKLTIDHSTQILNCLHPIIKLIHVSNPWHYYSNETAGMDMDIYIYIYIYVYIYIH